MTTSSNEIDQSQVYYGPFFLSFGDVHRQAIHAKTAYKLTDNESHILQAFIQAMPRPGYKTHLGAVMDRSLSFWAAESGLLKQNLSRGFKGLCDKKIIVTLGGKGKKPRHYMHQHFAQRVLCQDVCDLWVVENSEENNQIDDSDIINLIKPDNQIDDSDIINLIKPDNQIDYTPSYIEDPFLIPKESLTLPSSNPAVDMWISPEPLVDAAPEIIDVEIVAEPEEDSSEHERADLATRACQFLQPDSQVFAERFVYVVLGSGGEFGNPGLIESFLDDLEERKVCNLNDGQFGQIWADWRKANRTKHHDQNREPGSYSPN